MYSLAQAAKASGKSKPTIARAIKAGRISAARSEDGAYSIDPAELHRVYPVTGNGDGMMKQSVTGAATGTAPVTSPGDVETLRAWLADRDETIRDLRARLDAE